MAALTADGLTRRFGDLVAVDRLTFEVPSGAVAGFVGPNGSGKSTTIRMLLGLISPSAGTGTVLGEPIERPERFADRVGALIENPAFLGSLSGRDNLRSLAALRALPAGRVDAVLQTVALTRRGDDKASSYSLGMKQRLGIAAALLPDPELLVLDEPTNGLDPAGIVEIRELLKELAAGGRTVVVSSHLLAEIQAMVDNLVVIRAGKLLYSGGLEQLLTRTSARVVAAPEVASERPRLEAAVKARGWPFETADDQVIVDMPADRSADLYRVAVAEGIVLRMLSPQEQTLEEVFLDLTGTSGVDQTEGSSTPQHQDGA
ncbi:MAG: ATP-binding cassette domain-containing protein [Acidimicrobiaceae bacterium]|nr:ATP-binding cassette domain-containing protein [Acidimicrobiaceae bacterium]